MVYNFCLGCPANGCPDGQYPVAALISDSAGNLYGTSPSGGRYGYGAVVEVTLTSGTWTETVLHSFNLDSQDGITPVASLVLDGSGNLYGTTEYGGIYTDGTVFELTPNNGTWAESVLHSFGHAKDGATPLAGLILDSAGDLYGTTANGGVAGAGTVFELMPNGGTWTEKVLHSFNTKYGFEPVAGVIMDASGNLYGTTMTASTYGGDVFELVSNSGKWTEKVLHTFKTSRYGWSPRASLVLDTSGNLYGTTNGGGAHDDGVVFELTTNHGKWTAKVLHDFSGTYGMYPLGGLTLDSVGNLYGTTSQGGSHSGGTLFELTSSNGEWKENVLYAFSKAGTKGSFPAASLLRDSAGNLFGTTRLGGSEGRGTVFEISP